MITGMRRHIRKNEKRILNTVLVALFTVTIYWMATLAVQNIPISVVFLCGGAY